MMRKGKFSIQLFVLALVSTLLLSLPKQAAASEFTDVSKDFWAHKSIMYLAEHRILGGYSEGTFKPNQPITRAQVASILVNALDLSTENRPNPNFKDISTHSPAYYDVATVASEGILRGSNGYFRPGEYLTRAQMAAVLNRAFDLKYGATTKTFKDVSVDHWAFYDIDKIASQRITTGRGEYYGPNDPTTRAQFSVFISIIMEPETFQPKGDTNTVEWKERSTIYKEWVYSPIYGQSKTNYKPIINILRERLDGTEEVLLYGEGEKVSRYGILNFVGDKIYYEVDKQIYRMNLDGTGKEVIDLPFTPESLAGVEEGYLYATKWDETACGYDPESSIYPISLLRFDLNTGEVFDGYPCVGSEWSSGYVISDDGTYVKSGDEYLFVSHGSDEKVDVNGFPPTLGVLYNGHYYNVAKNRILRTSPKTMVKDTINILPNQYLDKYYLLGIQEDMIYLSGSSYGRTQTFIYKTPITGGELIYVGKMPSTTSIKLTPKSIFGFIDIEQPSFRIPIK